MVPVQMTNEPSVTPRNEEGSLEEFPFSPMTDEDLEAMDVLGDTIEVTRPRTMSDVEMSEVTTKSDLPTDIPIPDTMEDIMATP
jgi:hypothetical protein